MILRIRHYDASCNLLGEAVYECAYCSTRNENGHMTFSLPDRIVDFSFGEGYHYAEARLEAADGHLVAFHRVPEEAKDISAPLPGEQDLSGLGESMKQAPEGDPWTEAKIP